MEETKKNSNNILVLILVLVIIALGGFLVINLVGEQNKDNDKEITDTKLETQKEETKTDSTTDSTSDSNSNSTTDSTTTTSGSAEESGTADQGVDIDKDLKSIDSLDISNFENEYGEDSLGDL